MSIDSESTSYERMAAKWALPETVWAGTKALQSAGETYLPKHPAESDKNYQRRKKTVLTNFYRRSVLSLAGKPFKTMPFLNEDVPPRLAGTEADAGILDDIDLLGTGWVLYAQEWLVKAIRKGMAYTLVDFPQIAPNLTLREENEMGARPYAVMLDGSEVIGVKTANIGGKVALTEARIRQTIEVDGDDYDQSTIEQIRLIRQDDYEVYQRVKTDTDDEKKWALVDAGVNPLGVVPLVPLFTSKLIGFEAEPPLANLAEMNAEWWEVRSDQRAALRTSSFRILVVTGHTDSDDGNLVIGPNNMMVLKDPQSRAEYVSGDEVPLKYGKQELDDLEHKMRAEAMQFEVKDGAASTATARVIDREEALSPLQQWTLNLQRSMEGVLDLMALWEGLGGDGGTITFDLDFAPPGLDTADLEMLKYMHGAGIISDETMLAESKRRNILNEDVDADDEAERAKENDGGLANEVMKKIPDVEVE